MTDVGSQLRTAREAQGFTIDQAYKATRIKPIYLEAIEANRMSALPGPVQARGFVRSYANFLGLDGEALASALDAAPVLTLPNQPPAATKSAPIKPSVPTVTAKPLSPAPDRAVPRGRTLDLPSLPKISVPSARDTAPASPGGVPTSLLIIGAIVLFAIGVFLIISALTGNAKPAPSNGLDLNVPASAKPVAVPAATGATTLAGPVSITLEAVEHVWARITLDGQIAFDGVLQPGSSQVWTATDRVIVETGNAAAVRVNFKGATTTLGARGQIVARAWSRAGGNDVPVTDAAEITATGVQVSPVSISTATQRP